MNATLIQWGEDLATGIDWQDMQHQQLLDRLYKLYYALLSGEVRDEMDRVVSFLEDYAEKHLNMEEEEMVKYQFEEMEAHFIQHELFRERLNDVKGYLAESSGTSKITAAANLCMELNNWFVRHIGSFDQRLGAFLRQRTSQFPG